MSQHREKDEGELDLKEEEVKELEREIEQMAQKVLEYRTTLPDQLTSTLSSLLTSQRPVLPETDTRTHTGPDAQDDVAQGPPPRENMALSITEDSGEAEKIELLKQKIASNASTLPIVLNRMKDYMTRFDKLDSSNGSVHPVFQWRRTS